MKVTCFSCSAVSSPSMRSSRRRDRRQDGVQRGAELVAHVGEEARLHLGGAAQVVGLLVQLGVERHHAAVGVLQLAVELGQLLLRGASSSSRAVQQLLVLPCAPPRAGLRASAGPARRRAGPARRGATGGEPRRQDLAQRDDGARPGGLESISKWSISRRVPTRPMPMPSARRSGRRASPAGRRCPARGRSTRTSSAAGASGWKELDLAAAGVLEGVAGDLGDRGGDARLVLASKPSRRRPGAPAGGRAPRPAPGGSPR